MLVVAVAEVLLVQLQVFLLVLLQVVWVVEEMEHQDRLMAIMQLPLQVVAVVEVQMVLVAHKLRVMAALEL
jgi:hypothetical protein